MSQSAGKKRKILFVGEFSGLNTGYATYTREVMRRLHETGLFDLAELATYGWNNEPRICSLPWKYYPNMPASQEEVPAYESCLTNEFGEWKFEQTLLDFQPTHTVDVRDYWMCLVANSPILMKGGVVKPIEEVNVGDEVLTHKGRYRKVVHVFPSRVHRGTFVKILCRGVGVPVTMTGNHPVQIWDELELDYWKTADSVKVGDLVCFPIPQDQAKSLRLWECRFLAQIMATTPNQKGGDLLWWGRLPAHEKFPNPFIAEAENRFPEGFYIEQPFYFYGGRCLDFIQKYLEWDRNSWVMGEQLFHQPDREIITFLQTFFTHTLRQNRTTKQWQFATANRNLAYQLTQVLARLDLPVSLGSYPVRGRSRFILTFSSARDKIGQLEDLMSGRLADRPVSTAREVVAVETFEGEETVYNFEVEEDNSYVSSFAVHNCEFEGRSPFRPFYHLAWMPTCDAIPQNPAWLSTYALADSVFAYTDWGLEILRREGGGKIKTICSAPPGANLRVFQPVASKTAHKREFGLNPDSYIVGMVARNQARKLFPELFEAFSLFLATAPEHLTEKTYLYLHTCHPDLGWNIPRILTDFGVGHRVLFSYWCKKCRFFQPMIYQDAKTFCRRCGQYSMIMPTSQDGVEDDLLAAIYNLFDVYTQFSISEGFGMPLVEAAACGVPVMAVDYSAMEDVVRKLTGRPIRVERFYWESTTGRKMALPDHKDFIAGLVDLLLLPGDMRRGVGRQARAGVEEHYTYERTAKIWADHFLATEGGSLAWNSPPRKIHPRLDLPDHLSDQDWVDLALVRVAGRPDLIGSYFSQRLVRDLQWGMATVQPGHIPYSDFSTLGMRLKQEPFDRQKVVHILLKMVEKQNQWEDQRCRRVGVRG